MDLKYMSAGDPKGGYNTQLQELIELKQKYPDQCLPFVFVDPRRPGISRMMKDLIRKEGFCGIKIYPALGYWPFDDRLNEIYEFAESEEIPIISHCQRGSMFSREKITRDKRHHPKDPAIRFREYRKKKFCAHYTDPDNYHYVLEKYPRLKIDLAHFGGEVEWNYYLDSPWSQKGQWEIGWIRKIINLINTYENVYTDLAVMMREKQMIKMLSVLLEGTTLSQRVLYGSDYYMLQKHESETAFSMGIRSLLGEEKFRKIAHENALRFLSSKIHSFAEETL